MYTFLIFILFTFASCSMQKPVSVAHVERIEEKMMPIPVGADTIEITLCHPYGVLLNDTSLSGVCTPAYDISPPLGVNNTIPYSISSTRGVNISRHETDTTSTLRITLRPDTVFVPYTHHIRSDTIVVPDRVCQQKLNHSNMTNLFLILILIAIFIIYLRKSIAHRQ